MSFLVTSYRADLAKNKKNDHYGFQTKRRSQRDKAPSKAAKIETLTEEDDDEDDEDEDDESSDDYQNSDEDDSEDQEVAVKDEDESDDLWGDGKGPRKRRSTASSSPRKRAKAEEVPRFVARATTLAVTDETQPEAEHAKDNCASRARLAFCP